MSNTQKEVVECFNISNIMDLYSLFVLKIQLFVHRRKKDATTVSILTKHPTEREINLIEAITLGEFDYYHQGDLSTKLAETFTAYKYKT